MSDAGDKAVEKLSMVKDLTENKEVKLIAKIMSEYITNSEKDDLGFNGKGKK